MWKWCVPPILVFALTAVQAQQAPSRPPEKAPLPPAIAPAQTGASEQVAEVSADLGNCSAEFKVTAMKGKPIYAARVDTVIRYGFMNKRKIELEAFTNAAGLVRFTGMPETVKKPIMFDISSRGDVAHIAYDPSTNCKAHYDVPLHPGEPAPAAK